MASTTDKKYGTPWSHDELVLALYLYCQIPFAKTKSNNAEVIKLAFLVGRTPSSVARKLGNFGAFDPLLAEKGIVGLVHNSKADKQIWDEFYQNWNGLVDESQRIIIAKNGEEALARTPESTEQLQPIISLPTGPTMQARIVMTRLYQSFFRRAVLSSYQSSCCICGMDFPELLIASHIKPWAVSEDSRTDPENGLCLCVLHDKAYDKGLLSVNTNYEIMVSSALKKSKVKFVGLALSAFENQKIKLPVRFAPKTEYLSWHMATVFRDC